MNKIYYFTGTGNSLQIAEDVSRGIGDCTIHKIAGYAGENINSDTLGIVFPVYNWGMPLILCDFLEKLNVSNDTYIYAVANYGGLPGRALDQCRDILNHKNRVLSGGFLINMPGNYIMGYGAKSKKIQDKLFAKEKNKVKEICSFVRNRKKSEIEKSHFIIDRLCTNYFYKDIVKFHEAYRNFTVNNKCTGCGLCAKRCPVKNITINEGNPVWNHKCELCTACIQSCPKEAINYAGKTEKRKRYLNPNVKFN